MEKLYRVIYNNGMNHEADFTVDKTKLNDWFLLVDYLDTFLFAIEMDKGLGTDGTETLTVFHGDDILFDSMKSVEDFRKKYKIETRSDGYLNLYTVINDIRYHGEIVDGMLVDEPVSDPWAVLRNHLVEGLESAEADEAKRVINNTIALLDSLGIKDQLGDMTLIVSDKQGEFNANFAH